jgi:hypothetical protein
VIQETSAQPMLHSYDNYYNIISEGYDSDDIELKPTNWLIDHHPGQKMTIELPVYIKTWRSQSL